MASGRQIDLINKVQKLRKPFMTKPAMMHLISDMPDPAAYGAKDLTNLAEVKANRVCSSLSVGDYIMDSGFPTEKRK
jgi:hypothetical protein